MFGLGGRGGGLCETIICQVDVWTYRDVEEPSDKTMQAKTECRVQHHKGHHGTLKVPERLAPMEEL